MRRSDQTGTAGRRQRRRARRTVATRAPVIALLLVALAALGLPRRATSDDHTTAITARPAPSAPPALQPPPAPAALSVSVAAGPTTTTLPADFLGLSLETTALASPAMTTGAPVLANLLRELGPGLLRLSGASVDHTQWLPTPAALQPWSAATLAPSDLERLATLMRASGWRLLLGLNLGHLITAALVEEARAAASLLGPSLAGVAIGNEPDIFTRAAPAPFRAQLGGVPLRARGWTLARYLAQNRGVRGALAAGGVSAPVYGPETATATWLKAYAAAEHGGLAALTPHLYPLIRCSRGRPLRHGPTAASLLSRGVAALERRQLARFIAAASTTGLPLRVDETNSIACGGQPGTSDTFASALWALDYSLIAASDGVAGLNFHGGLGPCARGGGIISPWYSPLCTLPDGTLRARPEFYALLALRTLEGSAVVPVSYRTAANISAYALRAPDGTLHVVIDDMRLPAPRRRHVHPRPPAPIQVMLHVDPSYQSASVVALLAPGVAAREGVTLGGSSLRADGTLPAPVPSPVAGAAGSFVVESRPASATLITLSAHPARSLSVPPGQ
jgi:hypothetical protein